MDILVTLFEHTDLSKTPTYEALWSLIIVNGLVQFIKQTSSK